MRNDLDLFYASYSFFHPCDEHISRLNLTQIKITKSIIRTYVLTSVANSPTGDVGEVVKSGRYGNANQKAVPDLPSSLLRTPYLPPSASSLLAREYNPKNKEKKQ